VVCDIRDEAQVKAAVEQGVAAFGGIDVCINNASAISLTDTLGTDMKRYDLMSQVNARGTFLCSKLTLPHLLQASNPHILNLAPPLDLDPKWFARHVAYTTAKYGMSLCTLGMAAEFRGRVAVNSLWPITAIDTAAVRFALGGEAMAAQCRSPEIMADAAATSSSTRKCCAPRASATSRATAAATTASRCRATSSSPTRCSSVRRRR
jgi:citronellol/citronellal dehydrogenase